jgi:FdrA protein
MLLSRKAAELEGVEQVSAMMATENNKGILQAGGMLADEGDKAGPNDLIVCVKGIDNKCVELAYDRLQELLDGESQSGGDSFSFLGDEGEGPRDMDRALEVLGGGNLAFISLPGEYAAREAMKALDRNLHVMLFSDNVTLDQEQNLKQKARDKGLLVMGPDCGTAIINGIALGFANVVRRGPVGVVAASGTGLQAFTVLVEQAGAGISQAFGTGGRDLSAEIGASTMLSALEVLEMDPETTVVALISKPPHPEVADRVLRKIASLCKPAVVCFLGRDTASARELGIETATTLEEAAGKCAALANGFSGVGAMTTEAANCEVATQLQSFLSAWSDADEYRRTYPGKYMRGLYSGGTLCDEAIFVLQDAGLQVRSNIAVEPEFRLSRADGLVEHALVDLGEDEFTVGVPHPMIDFHLRNSWIGNAIGDPDTGVLLIDVVLGYGSNSDPASELLPVIGEAMALRQSQGHGKVAVVASVCGSSGDPQNTESQKRRLKDAGIIVLSTNARAAMVAEYLVNVGDEYFRASPFNPVNLIGKPLRILSMGLQGFAQSLKDQNVRVVHMGWRPPAGGDKRLIATLDRLSGLGES